ncbi:hypothetical protein G6F63_013384 [Rhizopus arrhizus]|nr:hypothetical protein G6F63_013384 [Rhizopus arrhizus]
MPDALGNGLAERGVDRQQDRTAVHLGQGTVVALRPGADPRPQQATHSERQQQLQQDAAGIGQPVPAALAMQQHRHQQRRQHSAQQIGCRRRAYGAGHVATRHGGEREGRLHRGRQGADKQHAQPQRRRQRFQLAQPRYHHRRLPYDHDLPRLEPALDLSGGLQPAVRQRPERPAAGGWPAWRDHAQTALGCQRGVWPQRHRLLTEELDQCLARSGQPDRVRSRPPDPDREERQRRLQLRVGRGRAGPADQRRLRWRVPPGDLPGARR